MTLAQAQKYITNSRRKMIIAGEIVTNHKLIALIRSQCVDIYKDPSLSKDFRAITIAHYHEKIKAIREDIKVKSQLLMK